LRKITGVATNALAVDPVTGDVWATILDGGIGQGHIAVISPSGRVKGRHAIPGSDIAYSSYDDSFWVVGKNVIRVDRKGKILGQIRDRCETVSRSCG